MQWPELAGVRGDIPHLELTYTVAHTGMALSRDTCSGPSGFVIHGSKEYLGCIEDGWWTSKTWPWHYTSAPSVVCSQFKVPSLRQRRGVRFVMDSRHLMAITVEL